MNDVRDDFSHGFSPYCRMGLVMPVLLLLPLLLLLFVVVAREGLLQRRGGLCVTYTELSISIYIYLYLSIFLTIITRAPNA
jgi:hypothetical protein